MPHTKARKFKPQVRSEPALSHWWQARKADLITITPRATLMNERKCWLCVYAGKNHSLRRKKDNYVGEKWGENFTLLRCHATNKHQKVKQKLREIVNMIMETLFLL